MKVEKLTVGLNVLGLFLVGTGLLAGGLCQAAEPPPEVRPAYHAGSWYPGDPATLGKTLDELLEKAAAPQLAGKPIALISPHAGYRFSAPVVASGYRALRGHAYKRVIVLAFSHRNSGRYAGVDVPKGLTAYRTPLGDVPIDRPVCDELLGHELFSSHPGVDANEHSLELQLPFLQRVLGEFQLVPMLVGRMSTGDYATAAAAILPLLNEDTLLVASSDFTHHGPRYGYEPFKEDVPNKLREYADRAAKPIQNCDFDGFLAHLSATQDTICGRGPITLLLRILSMRQNVNAVKAAFDTSGRITGDWSNSVTYQSFVFTERPGTLARESRERLLELARQTVTAQLRGRPLPRYRPEMFPQALRADGACFVTLENQGRLRGCIGNMVATGPLFQSVIRNAVLACQDRRFLNNPVTAAELDRIDIEISYLTPMKLVAGTDDIVVGRHGLMIVKGRQRGVLLPQVAARRGWTRETFLTETCRKAGLPPSTWRQPGVEIYSFEAEVFQEAEKEHPAGE